MDSPFSASALRLRSAAPGEERQPLKTPSDESGVRALPGEFPEIYDVYFPYVWKSVRRLGIPEASLDDVTQEIFLTVYRRLPSFEGRSSLKTWLFGITLHVVRDFRRAHRRREVVIASGAGEAVDLAVDGRGPPTTGVSERLRLLQALLDRLDDKKREVFVLSELGEMSAVEIAEATETNVNTVYARLRAARAEFEEHLARHRASIAQQEQRREETRSCPT